MGQDLHGVIVHYRRSSASPVVQYSRSTIGVDGRSPGGLYEVGEACLAPTQICSLLDPGTVCVRGRFRAPFPFAPAHSQRQSAKSAVRCSLGPEHSRSTIGVDGGSPGGLYDLGEACLAPTQTRPLQDRYGVRGRFRAPFPFAPAHSQRQSAKSAVRCSLGPEHSRSTIGVDGRSPGGLYEVGEAYLAPTQTRPRRERCRVPVAFHGRRSRSPLRIVSVNLRNLRFGVPCVRSIRGRQSGSMVVHLEVFTKWARHTSPLHRYAPDGSGMVCVGVSGRRSRSPLRIIGVNLRNLRFNSLSLEHSRSTIGVGGRSPGGLYEVGEAYLAPTQICPLLDRYCVRGRFRAPFPFAPAHSQRKSA